MSLLAHYQYLSKGDIISCSKESIKALTNPSASCTVDRVMVINPENSSFTLEEIKEITKFVKSLNKNHGNKSPNKVHSTGV